MGGTGLRPAGCSVSLGVKSDSDKEQVCAQASQSQQVQHLSPAVAHSQSLRWPALWSGVLVCLFTPTLVSVHSTGLCTLAFESHQSLNTTGLNLVRSVRPAGRATTLHTCALPCWVLWMEHTTRTCARFASSTHKEASSAKGKNQRASKPRPHRKKGGVESAWTKNGRSSVGVRPFTVCSHLKASWLHGF